MSQRIIRALFVFAVLVLCANPVLAENGMAIDPATCLGCHEDVVSAKDFANSVHGKNACGCSSASTWR